MKTVNKAIVSMLLASGLALASTAHAGIIGDSFTNSAEDTDIDQSNVLDLFDGSLGTLNAVTLTFTGTSTNTTDLINNSRANAPRVDYTSNLRFTFGVDTVSIGAVPDPAFTTLLATSNGVISVGANTTVNLSSSLVQSGSYSPIILSGSDIASFVGAGTFGVNCTTLAASSFVGGGGNIEPEQATTAFCGASIVYSYTPVDLPPVTAVPSPTTALLFGAGLMGLARLGRTKKKN